MLKLKEIHVQNFKSLKNCKFKFNKFNVLVGANASGKTNFVDLFLLLKKIYLEKDINPFGYWWGYQNAVWSKKEELSISVKFIFEFVDKYDSYNVLFETTFTGAGGKFEILREGLKIENVLNLELSGNFLKIKYYGKYLNSVHKIFKELNEGKRFFFPLYLRDKIKKFKDPRIIERGIWVQLRNLFQLRESRPIRLPYQNSAIIFHEPSGDLEDIIIFSPIIKRTKKPIIKPLLLVVLNEILELLSKTTILKLNINEVKRPSPVKKELLLSEDGSNLNVVLYNLYLKEERIPNRIANIISYLYPNINIKFSLTDDQRVYVKIYEDGLELPPPCMADGMYKTLAVLSALELKPSILIIDEIENSLHPKALEMILDELKQSDTIVIVTTHSPVVVDMTEPENLVIAEKIAGETKFRRIENSEEVKRRLKEAGITFSEGWLYGGI